MEAAPIAAGSRRYQQVSDLLGLYGIAPPTSIKCVDSSHGETDIRRNYLIDRKYVLRVNSAPVMTEARLAELNTLIGRYRAFGLEAPLFLKAADGRFLTTQDGSICYLSEYLDRTIADDIAHRCRTSLIAQRICLVARFAQTFRGVGLIDTVSMYSMFDLSPYDQLEGIEEKQDNLNRLTAGLRRVGETALAQRLEAENGALRRELLGTYQALPRCVFQGDENFSNLCVDENDRIVGLFDFNMAGTEVIANYLANLAFQGNFFYTDEMMAQCTADEIFRVVLDAYRQNTALIRTHYIFTPQELHAYRLYSKIVMFSAYWNTCAFLEYLEQYPQTVTGLLWQIAVAALSE